jgi:tetratricopeptide (TPR) repeat protein
MRMGRLVRSTRDKWIVARWVFLESGAESGDEPSDDSGSATSPAPCNQSSPAMAPLQWAAVFVLLAILAAYANHFGNSFHFDDFHTVTGNPAIRSLSNVPRFFVDAGTFSILPSHQTYRPLVPASLALDYWIGGGLRPVTFHLSAFFWFLVQLVLMYVFVLRVFHRMPYPALFAVALYGLHPVSAETVNYVVQRGDLYATLGAVAGVAMYALLPGQRRWGLYLAPALAGMLGKPTALVFAPILLAYIALLDRGAQESLASCLRRAAPAFLLSFAYAIFQGVMTPASYSGSAFAPFDYWITQPFVTLRYVRSFFLPFYLSADTDLRPFTTIGNARALAGIAFCLALAGAAFWTSRRPRWRPVSFGLFWFLIGLAPTALTPLSEVENDHRMFLPFVGLAISVTWAGWLLLGPRRTSRGAMGLAAAVLIACAWGTHARNNVWRTEETLWSDVTQKSPGNGRGWMNYGLTQMQKGDLAAAYAHFERARALTPNYSLIEINLGIASGALARDAEAEQHFRRAIELAPADSQSYSYYGKWLGSRGRLPEALAALNLSITFNPADPAPRESLALLRAREDTASPEQHLADSLAYYRLGLFEDCIRTAQEALRSRPDYAEAYNNIAAGYQSMGRWDEAIAAAEHALRLKPDLQIARNNLQYARTNKAVPAHRSN